MDGTGQLRRSPRSREGSAGPSSISTTRSAACPLHDVGCERDRAGHRSLHYDQNCMLILLFFFNPSVQSVRGLNSQRTQERSKEIGCHAPALGSLSDPSRSLIPKSSKEIIATRCPARPLGRDPRLKTFVRQSPSSMAHSFPSCRHLTEASLNRTACGGKVKWKLHTHFWKSIAMCRTASTVTPNAAALLTNAPFLERTVEPDRLYVMDRGYAKFAPLKHIVANQEQLRLPHPRQQRLQNFEEKPLSSEARAPACHQRPDHRPGERDVRSARPSRGLITIEAKPHQQEDYARRPSTDGSLRILTNLMDVPAEVVACFTTIAGRSRSSSVSSSRFWIRHC